MSNNIQQCDALMSVCDRRLYVDNAFRVVELPIDASSRDIKRRLDDLKMAVEVDDLTDEYTHAFAPTPLPSVHAIRQAGQRLQDPRKRFIDEFFWFWPLDWSRCRSDEALISLSSGHMDRAHDIWSATKNEDSSSDEVLAAKHNLAVLSHLVALDWEARNLAGGPPLLPEQAKEVEAYWRYSFQWWEELADHEPFWSLLSDRVRAINDPQLTTGFVRDLRAAFPIAFDKVNADVAAALAKVGQHDRAALHIRFMRETHQGMDDTSETLRVITQPLHERIDHAINQASNGLNASPKTGAIRATRLLEAITEPLNTLRSLLGTTDSEVTETADEIVETYHLCLIAYGNATEDWLTCTNLLKSALGLTPSQTLKEKLQNNIAAAKKNHEQAEIVGKCWFCKKTKPDAASALEVKMHAGVTRVPTFTGTQVRWRTSSVTVPRCAACKTAHGKNGATWTAGLAGAAAGTAMLPIVGTIIGFLAGAAVGAQVDNKLRLPPGVSPESEHKKFPLVQNMLKEGWELGEKPSGVN